MIKHYKLTIALLLIGIIFLIFLIYANIWMDSNDDIVKGIIENCYNNHVHGTGFEKTLCGTCSIFYAAFKSLIGL